MELCEMAKNKKYDNYCRFCYVHLFPDTPLTRNFKTKESSVVESIKFDFPDLTWISDKTVFDGCSKRRPDLLLDLGYQVIIIEIDENQHIDYDTTCENKRTMEISQDLNFRPIIFIRFNPDEYINESGNKITSCWLSGNIKKSKQVEWTTRLNMLKDQIRYWCNTVSDKTVEINYLFYNQLL